MFVIKRNGKKEAVHFDKITARIHKLIYGLSISEKDVIEIAKKVIQGARPGPGRGTLHRDRHPVAVRGGRPPVAPPAA